MLTDEEKKIYKEVRVIYLVFYFLLMILAILLAMQSPQATRVSNISLAIIFPPVYIIAHFISLSKSD